MKFISTRGKSPAVTAAEAIRRGLAPDGGLYVPDELPVFSASELEALYALPYAELSAAVLERFLPGFSREELLDYTKKAYPSFDDDAVVPLHALGDKLWTMELFHGPTCAFKDVALQILPYLLAASVRKCADDHTVAILVATSGDTGKAALEGFADVPGTKIAVFYPDGGVSDIQRAQMATQGGNNVLVLAVRGNFDDAQTGVKDIFADAALASELDRAGVVLSSANSINWGRLAPQIAYYFAAYAQLLRAGAIAPGERVDFSVPTGNFGDILAGYFAKRAGLPVGKLLCASNSNNVLTDFLRTGVYDKNRPFLRTMSPSMDILVSSNLERLLYLAAQDGERVSEWMRALFAARESTPSAKNFSDSLRTRALPPFSRPRRKRRASSAPCGRKKVIWLTRIPPPGSPRRSSTGARAGKCAPRSRSPRPHPSSSPRRCSLRSAKMCRKTALPRSTRSPRLPKRPSPRRSTRCGRGRSVLRPWSIKTKCANP